jgi:hypothetical protein
MFRHLLPKEFLRLEVLLEGLIVVITILSTTILSKESRLAADLSTLIRSNRNANAIIQFSLLPRWKIQNFVYLFSFIDERLSIRIYLCQKIKNNFTAPLVRGLRTFTQGGKTELSDYVFEFQSVFWRTVDVSVRHSNSENSTI